MKKLVLRKTTIRLLTPRQISAVAGGIFEQERNTLELTTPAGVSGPEPKASDTCSWGCTHICTNGTCA